MPEVRDLLGELENSIIEAKKRREERQMAAKTPVDQTKALVQKAAVERADRNQVAVDPEQRAAVRRFALDEFLTGQNQLDAVERQLKGTGIDPERFVRSIVTLVTTSDALRSKIPSSEAELVGFNRSVMRCALNIAALKLDPSPHFGHVWVVPFNQRGRNGQPDQMLATLIVGYQGYVALAARTGWAVDADVIWEGQQFQYNRLDPTMCSIGYLDRLPEPDETPRAVFWMATEKATGFRRLIINPYGMYLRARERSESWKEDQKRLVKGWKLSSPWSTDEIPMVLKTAIRWNRKLVPMGDAVTEAAQQWAHANRVDGGVFSGRELPAASFSAPTVVPDTDVDIVVREDDRPVEVVSPPRVEPVEVLLGELREWGAGENVAGWDMSAELEQLAEEYGLSWPLVFSILRGESTDEVPAEFVIAAHALCARAAAQSEAGGDG